MRARWLCCTGLVAPWHVGSSQTRDQARPQHWQVDSQPLKAREVRRVNLKSLHPGVRQHHVDKGVLRVFHGSISGFANSSPQVPLPLLRAEGLWWVNAAPALCWSALMVRRAVSKSEQSEGRCQSSKALGFKGYWERSVCWPRWALIQATDPTECLPCVRRWLIR